MTRVYRLLRRAYAKNPFDGEGAFRYGGRWSSPGTRLVYTAEHQSLAMLEYFVHLDLALLPRDLVLVAADIPDGVSRERASTADLPRNWRTTPAPDVLRKMGDDFVVRGDSAILVLPSALAPEDNNWILNPAHPHFARIRKHPPVRFTYDSRFFKR